MDLTLNKDLRKKLSECLTYVKNYRILQGRVEKMNGYDTNKLEDRECLIYRFFKRQHYNVDKAAIMIQNYLNWRIAYNQDYLIDNFHYDEIANVRRYFTHYFHKTGHQNQICHFIRLENLDIKNALRYTTPFRFSQYYSRGYGYHYKYVVPYLSQKQGEIVDKAYSIVDMKNGTLKFLFTTLFWMISFADKLFKDNHPNLLLDKMIFLNAPTGFATVWSILKPLADEDIRNRIDIYTAKDKNPLLKYMPIQNIPKYYGGSCQCSNCRNNNYDNDIYPWE